MMLTWRQVMAYVIFNEKLDGVDRTYDLLVARVAAQGDEKAVEKAVKELTS